MVTAIAALFVFFLVVIFHEFGHFIVAKSVGIKVNEFSIGMGPRLLKLRKGETDYSIRALPIGGYVKMEGEDENSEDERSFNKKPVLSRMAVIVAGAFMNFLLAILIYCIISYVIGAPTTVISEVSEGLPAYEAGIKSGDKITRINDDEITSWDELVTKINESEQNEIKVTVLRDNQELDYYITPVIDNETNRIVIGITPQIRKSLMYSIKSGFERTIFYLTTIFEFLILLITGKGGMEQVTGPVGVIHLVGEAAKIGFIPVLSLAGFISINLGLFNLLPIPALDGSRFMFLLVELFRGRPVDPDKEGFVHFIGFVFLILLMLVIVYKDLVRFNIFW